MGRPRARGDARVRSLAAWAGVVLVALSAAPGCDDESTTEALEGSLPELLVLETSQDLLFTWIDAKGATHTEVKPTAVPPEGRRLVRVITPKAGNGSMFYIADLTRQNGQGHYEIHPMPRAKWELVIDKRRAAHRAQHAPAAPAPRTGQPPGKAGRVTPTGSVQATVYGAVWCGPCHQAKRYLKKRGATVAYHDIEKQPRYAREMRRKLAKVGRSGGTIPVIDIAGEVMVGFNPRACDAAIQRARSATAL